MQSVNGPDARCAVHPVRPAVDRCPRCGRARCAVDAEQPDGCRACTVDDDATPAAGRGERLVRGTLAAFGTALLGGLVAAQYVDAELFAYLTPFVVGVVCGAAAQAAAGGAKRGPTALRVRAAATLCAVLGVGLGMLLEGSHPPVSSATLVPALLAVTGAVLWTMPPRRAPTPSA